MNNGRSEARRNVALTTLGAGLVMCMMHGCSWERGTTGKGPVGAESSKAAAVTASRTDSVAAFEGLRDRLVADWLAETPTVGRALGLHEFDGKLRDHSKDGLLRALARNKEVREKLAKVTPETLNEDLQLDLALAKLMVDEEIFHLEDLEEPWKNPRFYEDLFAVNDYVMRPYAPLPERAQRLLQHEEAALKEVPHVVANLRLPLSKVVAQVASKNYAGFAIYLRGDVAKTVAEVKDSAFQARFAKTNEALAQEADKLSLWLAEQAKAGDASHVLGRERFEKYLRVFEGLSMPLAEFKRLGEENLAKNKAAYEALRKVVSPTRPKASELLKLATELVDSSRKFVQDKHIVTMPSADTAVVKETPPYARWNSASLEVSGPFDPHKSAFYFITLPDPSWPLKEQEEYVFSTGSLIATTVHEVYPGHFVQGRWAERAPTRLQKIYGSYSFVEGWAHYVEEMMLEEGFASTDQARLGQLEDALLRNCRFVASVGMHTEGMSVEQAEERFMRDCHIAKAEARAQAIRGTFDPGYFAYTLGKLEILQLRDEAKKKLGPKFSLQRFHDALLAQGSPPVALIREKVLRVLQ